MAWVDEDSDGQLDADEDEKQVDVKVVKPWTSVGNWEMLPGFVKANADVGPADHDRVLKELAKSITNQEADFALLGNVGNITKDKQIDVTPLIKKLEERLREAVKQAALGGQHAEFSGTADPKVFSYNESQVRKIFEGGSGDPILDCAWMVALEFAYGAISQLKAGEFDQMGLRPASFGQSAGGPNYVALSQTRPWKDGDWIQFNNFEGTATRPSYRTKHKHPLQNPKGAWEFEHTIMVGNGLYYGFGRTGARSALYWRNELTNEYNKVTPTPNALPGGAQVLLSDIPQPFKRGFIDAGKLGQKLFNLRTKQ